MTLSRHIIYRYLFDDIVSHSSQYIVTSNGINNVRIWVWGGYYYVYDCFRYILRDKSLTSCRK